MQTVEAMLEGVLENIAGITILLFEFVGVIIIIWSGLTSIVKWLKHAGDTGVYLARGLAMALEFKMGSEILRTVIVREWREIGIVAGIIALRAALTFLLHWEIREEEQNGEARNREAGIRETGSNETGIRETGSIETGSRETGSNETGNRGSGNRDARNGNTRNRPGR